MGNRLAPAGERRILTTLLVVAMVASLIQIVNITPAKALSGEYGPAVVSGTDITGLTSPTDEWATKNQHRIWWNADAGRWDAVLPTGSGWQIAKGAIPQSAGAAPTYVSPVVSTNAGQRPDVFWDASAGRLFVLMSGSTASVFVYDYASGGDTYTLVNSSTVPGLAAAESRAVIYKDNVTNSVWAAVLTQGGLAINRSTNDGQSWIADGNNIPVLIYPVGNGQTELTSINDGGTDYLAVAAAEDGDASTNLAGGRYSEYLFYKLDLTNNVGTWNTADHSSGTLTMLDGAGQPADGDTFTIGSRTYTFQTAAITDTDGDGAVLIGVDAAGSLANLAAAVGGTGTAGPGGQYSGATLPHADVGMFDNADNTATVIAKEAGADQDSIATTVGGSNTSTASFAAATLTGGAMDWVRETIPLAYTSNPADAVVHADDELSLVKDSSDNIYMVTETQRTCVSMVDCAIGIGSDPQIILYDRTPSGTWTQHDVKLDQTSTTGDRKRPVVALLDSNLYIISVDSNRSESSYWVNPTSSLDGWGSTDGYVFNTNGESVRNNIVPRFATTAATGLPVLVDDLTDDTIWQNKLTSGYSGNQAPGVDAGADLAGVNGQAQTSLAGQVTDDNAGGTTPLTIAWTAISGPGTVTFANAAQAATTASFSVIGTYVLRLTATESGTDPLSNYDEVSVNVTTLNVPPTLTVTKPSEGQAFVEGTSVAFQGSADDQGSNITAAIKWTSNLDGQIGTGGSFSKSNLSVGSHTITVSVSDGTTTVEKTRHITILSSGGGGGGGGGTPDNPFIDDDGNIFENDIEWLAAQGITAGCNPPTNNKFCPNSFVTRGQMAAFLVRALGYTDNGGGNLFIDDDNSVFENDIDKLGTAGVTKGCNPPTNNKYCPEAKVTRGQMAAFLVRALGYTDNGGGNLFIDDDNSVFENDIDKLGTAGVTAGCNPPTNNKYCPGSFVTRGQMAAFLHRALTS